MLLRSVVVRLISRLSLAKIILLDKITRIVLHSRRAKEETAMRRTIPALLGVALTTALLSGCSDDGGGGTPVPTATSTKLASVTATRQATIPVTSTATIPGTIPASSTATRTATPVQTSATSTPSGGSAVSGFVVV